MFFCYFLVKIFQGKLFLAYAYRVPFPCGVTLLEQLLLCAEGVLQTGYVCESKAIIYWLNMQHIARTNLLLR